MRIGSLFAGIGGLDLACEMAFGARTVFQLDLVNAAVRRRHFPDALQITADIATVDPLDLPRVEVLCAGTACQDLSTAGKQASKSDLLAGTRTGPTYAGMLRFVEALRPEFVVLENVPALLHHRVRIERDLKGYGLTWVEAMALDVGAPHRRARVFVVAVRGGQHQGVIGVPQGGRWSPVENSRPWPTTTANDCKATTAERYSTESGRHSGVTLTDAVRPWASPTASSPNEHKDPATWHARRAELAERHGNNGAGEPLGQQFRTWASVKASDARSPGASSGEGAREGADGLAVQVRPWPTATARDYRVDFAEPRDRAAGESLSQAAACGSRLNPAWVETLMGYPEGWTEPHGPRLQIECSPRWPRGRYPESWDRSKVWPGFDWEPSRTLPDGPPERGRPARIKALGNAVVPAQGAFAISAVLEPRAQLGLFGGSR